MLAGEVLGLALVADVHAGGDEAGQFLARAEVGVGVRRVVVDESDVGAAVGVRGAGGGRCGHIVSRIIGCRDLAVDAAKAVGTNYHGALSRNAEELGVGGVAGGVRDELRVARVEEEVAVLSQMDLRRREDVEGRGNVPGCD
jgi:hypothetical protein